MKKLREFQKFDTEAFFKDKNLIVKEVKDTLEYVDSKPSGNILGTTVVAAIVEDNTIYADDEKGLNFMETFNIKILEKGIEIAQGTRIKPQNITKASVYGEYQNNLSIECGNVQIVKMKENNG